MLRFLSALATIAVVVTAQYGRPIRACGPWFEPTLLADRSDTLLGLPDGSFLLEARRLVPRPALPFVALEGEPGNEGATATRAPPDCFENYLYLQGAAAFHAGDVDGARQFFRAVLALPAAERRARGAHAAFSLGRLGEARSFSEVRRLVASGEAVDDEGLAVASYGEQARMALHAGNDVEAIHLYAAQASFDSSSGATSLLFVARAVIDDPVRLRRALRDPVGQRLITTWAWTRSGESRITSDGEGWEDAAAADQRRGRVLRALLREHGELAGADALAAALYRTGRFDDAAAVVARAADTGLTSWVKAKLALRAGDRLLADDLLARAIELTSATERWPGDAYGDSAGLAPRARLIGERAALALASDRVDDAMRLLWSVHREYWTDVATVAERALTTDELIRFVDALPASDAPGAATPDHDDGMVWSGTSADLRGLLARRLLREHRLTEAARYLDGLGEHQESAISFIDALRAADVAASDAERAEQLWRAAQLARRSGIELLATELGPDWALYQGALDPGSFAFVDQNDDDDAETPARATDPMVASLDHPASSAWVGAAERAATGRHAPPHPFRFHYRHTAALLAAEAASLVPPRTQAFAALLCFAAAWTPDQGSRGRFYRQWIERGAAVDFSSTFGESCPAPRFHPLVLPEHEPPGWWSTAMPKLRPRQVALTAAAATACLCAATLLLLRRRRAGAIAPPPP